MESDILCQPYYEVYNEDTLIRCISFLIEKEKILRNNVEISQGVNPSVYLCYLENYINKNVLSADKAIGILY